MLHRNRFPLNNQPDALSIQIYFVIKLHVSGIFFAHHQEFSAVLSALVSFMQVLMTASKQSQDVTPVPSVICASSSSHIIFLHMITFLVGLFDENYKPRSSSLCNFLHSPVTSIHLGSNAFLNTLFSQTLSPLFCLSIRQLRIELNNSRYNSTVQDRTQQLRIELNNSR